MTHDPRFSANARKPVSPLPAIQLALCQHPPIFPHFLAPVKQYLHNCLLGEVELPICLAISFN
jgi:hypothetical protein